jgi:ubiquinone/menaquinone biosynthesis C-methylase UbiE
MFRLEDSLWWYQGQSRIAASLLERYLPRREGNRILDCGAGTGGSLAFLSRFGEVTSLEYSQQAVELNQRRGNQRLVHSSAAAMPFASKSFDLLTVFDVFYSLDLVEENEAIFEAARVLAPGGTLLWREPAFQFLYGPHDRATHGKRRYTRSDMTERMRRAGLKPQRLSYANTLLFPVAVLRRMLARLRPEASDEQSDVQPVSEPLNTVLAKVLGLEAPLVMRFGLPVGLSVIAVASKP